MVNRVVDDEKEDDDDEKDDRQVTHEWLRAQVVNNDSPAVVNNPWLKDVPADIRDEAVRDLLKAYKSAAARFKKDRKSYQLKKHSKKRLDQESITIPSKHWEHKSGEFAFLQAIKQQTNEHARTDRN